MATVKDDELQVPAGLGATQAEPACAGPGPVPEGDAEVFRRGRTRGRELAEEAQRKLAAWAEQNPAQMLLAGLATGFVLGKIFLRPRRLHALDEE